MTTSCFTKCAICQRSLTRADAPNTTARNTQGSPICALCAFDAHELAAFFTKCAQHQRFAADDPDIFAQCVADQAAQTPADQAAQTPDEHEAPGPVIAFGLFWGS